MKRVLIILTLSILTLFTLNTLAIHLSRDTTVAAASHPAIKQALKKDLNPEVAELAYHAYIKAKHEGHVHNEKLTIIDYTKPSNRKRLWVLDMKKNKVLFHELVAHGKQSGDIYAKHFSNKSGSHQSSVGVYETANTYTGSKGFSLRLAGLEKGYNDHAMSRAIVIHGAWYAEPGFVKKYGRTGGSWGCPAVANKVAKPLIQTIKNGSVVFAYGKDSSWLSHSQYLA